MGTQVAGLVQNLKRGHRDTYTDNIFSFLKNGKYEKVREANFHSKKKKKKKKPKDRRSKATEQY
jgi:hypothetical protein